MVEQSSVPSLLPPCNNEDEQYQCCLDACIKGIENFPVNKRLISIGMCNVSHLIPHSTRLTRPSRWLLHHRLFHQACSDLAYACGAI